jgi:hypothetical protein
MLSQEYVRDLEKEEEERRKIQKVLEYLGYVWYAKGLFH